MNKQIGDFNELISKAGEYLDSNLGYSLSTIGNYRREWKRIRHFMSSKEIKHYDEDVEKQILHFEFGDRHIRELSNDEKQFYNAVKMLSQFRETGTINVPARPHKDPLIFDGPIGNVITHFLEYKKIEARVSIITLNCYQRYLFRFLSYCNQKNIFSLGDINLTVILHYIGELTCNVFFAISTLRGFLKYAFDQKLLVLDYAAQIPRHKSVNQPKLPSTYSKEEMEKLILSVERSSAIGKRNYAIILIAARLGLRASDICRLKFDHLHWNTSIIQIRQFKTGKELTLPLLPDVGNAIIDYLKYGRPESDEPYLFLTERPPYGHFSTSNVVTHVVQRAFRTAGIDINGKRSGPHSLRHTLGFRMLEESTILPVISEVLGHESTQSTRYYLRIDLKSMKQCMLDVPPIAIDFYEQKGGVFYE